MLPPESATAHKLPLDALAVSSLRSCAVQSIGLHLVAALLPEELLPWNDHSEQARLAARRYESVDPDKQLVAAELEALWNTVLQKTKDFVASLL
jgi:hypothetical protein